MRSFDAHHCSVCHADVKAGEWHSCGGTPTQCGPRGVSELSTGVLKSKNRPIRKLSPVVITCLLALTGCAKEPPVQVADTFCLTAKKRTWDPDADSIQTMREAVVFNRAVDRRCGYPGQKA